MALARDEHDIFEEDADDEGFVMKKKKLKAKIGLKYIAGNCYQVQHLQFSII